MRKKWSAWLVTMQIYFLSVYIICRYILRVSRRPEFDVIYSRTNEIERQRATSIFHKRLLPAVSWNRGRPKKARGWKIADLPKDAKAVVSGTCQKPGHTRQTCRGLKALLAGKENQNIFQDIWLEYHFASARFPKLIPELSGIELSVKFDFGSLKSQS